MVMALISGERSSIDSVDYKSRLIKRMDLELAALESKQSVQGALTLDDKSS